MSAKEIQRRFCLRWCGTSMNMRIIQPQQSLYNPVLRHIIAEIRFNIHMAARSLTWFQEWRLLVAQNAPVALNGKTNCPEFFMHFDLVPVPGCLHNFRPRTPRRLPISTELDQWQASNNQSSTVHVSRVVVEVTSHFSAGLAMDTVDFFESKLYCMMHAAWHCILWRLIHARCVYCSWFVSVFVYVRYILAEIEGIDVSGVKCRLLVTLYRIMSQLSVISLSCNVPHHLKSWYWQLCLSRRLMASRLMDALCWAESLPVKRWRLKMRNWSVYGVKVGPLGLFWRFRCSTSMSVPSHKPQRDIASSVWHPKLSQRRFRSSIWIYLGKWHFALTSFIFASPLPISP